MKLIHLANRAILGYQNAADRRWRIPPRITVLPATDRTTIYYLSPAENTPSGGVKVIYRHVEILNDMGIAAAVFHQEDGFVCDWFDHRAPVVSAKSLRFHANDILVVPECYGFGFAAIPEQIRKVVFNQGPHHTFDQINFNETESGAPYRNVANLEGILTVSEDGAQLLRYAFPWIDVAVARNVISPINFRMRETTAPRRISYVPSRRQAELEQVLHVLRSNGVMAEGGWQVEPISGRSESETGNILRQSSIFMSLSDRDGFGLPPAEAMATGCYVVGYAGGGGNEFFDASYSRQVVDSTGMVREMIAAMLLSDQQREEYGAKASARIRGQYSHEGLRDDLERFFGRLL
ncbi:glycosyltransferase [Paeniglutamicibacter sp. MACA_103]|uniref:glycosyltransferase n=1 Tax=Paeniglutamicibacter sp. MACA_103 TaxID=3377337 RepID=UPI003893842F